MTGNDWELSGVSKFLCEGLGFQVPLIATKTDHIFRSLKVEGKLSQRQVASFTKKLILDCLRIRLWYYGIITHRKYDLNGWVLKI